MSSLKENKTWYASIALVAAGVLFLGLSSVPSGHVLGNPPPDPLCAGEPYDPEEMACCVSDDGTEHLFNPATHCCCPSCGCGTIPCATPY